MSESKITNERLEEIFKRSAARLRSLGVEGEEEVLEMIHKRAEELQDAGGNKKLVVKLTHSIEIDFTNNKQTDRLGFSRKVKLERAGDMDDPDQDEMDFGDESEPDEFGDHPE
jgi:hypothetical protein